MPFDKAASGSTDIPLNAERDRAYIDGEAEARIQKWASSDGSGAKDKMGWDKYASVHFWRDPSNKTNFSGYKLKFADIVDGQASAIWHAVVAVAAVMQGARGGVDIPDADRAGVKRKVEAYYAKARDKFNDDTIQVPWAAGKSAAEITGEITKAVQRANLRDGKTTGEMRQAWATLEIKSIDNENWTFKGIASTPEIDLGEDSMDPMGAQYTLPMPFLWQHGKGSIKDPVGWITAADPGPKGIPVEGQIAKPKADYPQPLVDELKGVWVKIRDKLVRGLSIGWQGIESEPIKGNPYATRWTKWGWYETSGVSLPMNVQASITSVKSIDIAQQAALSGTKPEREIVRLNSPAVAGPKPKGSEMSTIAEQVSAYESKRSASVAAMSEIMKKSESDGRTLTQEEDESYDGLKREVETCEKHIGRLKDHEQFILRNAAPIDPKSNGGGAGNPDEVRTKSNGNSKHGDFVMRANGGKDLPKGTAFTRYVMCLANARGNLMLAAERAKMFRDSTPEVEIAFKTAVAAGTTTDATWAGPLVQLQPMAAEFVEFLRPMTVFGRIPNFRMVPFNVSIPRQTAGSSSKWAGQGLPKPVSKLGFDLITMRFAKQVSIVVTTDELVRFSNPAAESTVRNDMARAIAQFTDEQALNPDVAAVSNVSPASITNGATKINFSAATIAGVDSDVAKVYAELANNDVPLTGCIWVMAPRTAIGLSSLRTVNGVLAFPEVGPEGGTFKGYPVLTTNNIHISAASANETYAVFLNPSEIFVSDDGAMTIDMSSEASIEMSDAPSGGATSLVSMYQNNLIALRAERYINYLPRHSHSVVVWDGITL